MNVRQPESAPPLEAMDGMVPPPVPETPAPALVHLPLARRLIAFGFLLLAEFFYGWAWNTVDVLRPLFRASLHLSLTEAGSAYSAQGAGALLGALSIGQLADRNLAFLSLLVGEPGDLLGPHPQRRLAVEAVALRGEAQAADGAPGDEPGERDPGIVGGDAGGVCAAARGGSR